MKKIFYIIIMALCLTACCGMEEVKRQEVDIEKEYLYFKGSFHLRVYRFEYNSHKYILFYAGEDKNGFVHDPDCPCHEQYINKGKTSDYPDWW